MKRWLAVLLLCPPAFGALGTPVPLTITDRSGVPRVNEGVTTGVPIPQAANVLDVRNLMVTTSVAGVCAGGAAVNSMLHVVERWNGTPSDTTKAIRWVWVEIVAPNLAANASVVYCLADRVGADPGGSPLAVTNSGGFITVNTGAMTFKVSTTAFNFLDTVTVGGTTVVSSSSSNKWSVTAGGVEYGTSNPDPSYSAVVEQPAINQDANSAGEAIRAQIKVTGKFTSSSGTQKMNYQMRLIAYANGTTIKCYPTLTFSEDMFAFKPTGIVLSAPLAIGNALAYTFGTQTGTSSAAYTTADDVYLLQYDHGHGTPANLPGYAIVKNGMDLGADNHQSPGWLDINDGSNGATVWVRDFWQQYPGELEAKGKTLNVHLWPSNGDTAIGGVGDGVTGPMTQVFYNKRDASMQNGSLPYGTIWPYAAGQAMDLTPQAPNPNRTILTLTQSAGAGQPTTFTAKLNTADTAEGYCTNQPGASCHYWQAGATQRVYLNHFTGCWAALNGFQTATFTGTIFSGWPQITVPVDTSGCTLPVTPTLNQGLSTDPSASNIDSMTDMQAQGFAKTWEIQYQFYAGGLATPANSVAKMKDRLMLVNPSWLANSQAAGRIKEVDPADFPAAETNVNNAWNAFTTSVDTNNIYGMLHYGDYIYDPASLSSGFGNRWWAFSRKNWRLVPWMMYIRSGDPQYLSWAIPITIHGLDVDLQHVTIGPYVDANGNSVMKHVGSGPCTHGPTHYYPSFGGYPGATGGGYDCQEGEEPTLDYVSGAAEMMYVLLAYDRGEEVVVNEQAPFLAFVDTTYGTILDHVSGRGFGGCLTLAMDTYKLSGTYLNYAEKCFQGAVKHNDGTSSIGNPVGNVQGDKYGNGIDWSYFTDSWVQLNFPEMAELDPNYCALDANNVSHCVRTEFNRFARAFSAMGANNGTAGVYYYNFQGKTWSYAYSYTGDPAYLQYGKRIYTQFLMPSTFIAGPNPDVHCWTNYMLNMPFAEYALLGQNPAAPAAPPYFLNLPADGSTVNFLVNKTADQAWNFTFSIDTGDDFAGGFFNLAGTVNFDVYDPTGALVQHNGLSACTYQGPTPCIPNSYYPNQSNTMVAGQGESVTWGGVDNRVFTFNVPADGKTGDYTIKLSAVNQTGGTCVGSATDRYTCYTTTHFAFPMGTSLGNMVLVAPSVLNISCPTSPYQTAHVGRGLYYFNVPAGTAQIKFSMSQGNYFLLDPSGNLYKYGSTQTVGPNPGIWTLGTNSQLDDGNGMGYCISAKGIKPLFAQSPQYYYDSPNQAVSSVIQDYGGAITVNFGGFLITTSTTLPGGTVGSAYSPVTLATSGGTGAVTFTKLSGSFPAGISMSGAGVISGTPTQSGTFLNIVIQATDSATPTPNQTTATFSITVGREGRVRSRRDRRCRAARWARRTIRRCR